MALPDPTPAQDEPFVAADLPIDDPATIAPDEGDIGHADPKGSEHAVVEARMLAAALTPAQVAQERSLAVQAAQVALAHRDAVHYTQSPRRWDGINRALLGSRVSTPTTRTARRRMSRSSWNFATTVPV
jgi:hypothetical protein